MPQPHSILHWCPSQGKEEAQLEGPGTCTYPRPSCDWRAWGSAPSPGSKMDPAQPQASQAEVRWLIQSCGTPSHTACTPSPLGASHPAAGPGEPPTPSSPGATWDLGGFNTESSSPRTLPSLVCFPPWLRGSPLVLSASRESLSSFWELPPNSYQPLPVDLKDVETPRME